MKNISHILLAFIIISPFYSGCKKSFLDEKPSTSIVQPTTIEEFQSLLDNYDVVNVTTGLGILAADDYSFYSDAVWQSARTATQRNSYVWARDLYEGEVLDDWNKPYSAIFYANSVLLGLDKLPVTSFNGSQWNHTKGWALFVRAFAYYELVNDFAAMYDAENATNDLGVPLRLNPSIDELLPRSSVKENYNRIIADLTLASQLLNTSLPLANRNRPSKVAAHALFARIYLNMRDYGKAELHADTCLQLYNKLIDYNTLSKTSSTPFSLTNDELIYSKLAANKPAYSANSTYTHILPDLINLYSPNDLRLVLYYAKQADGSYRMKRGYHGNGANPFTGLATDEVYLIKAECLARRGIAAGAIEVLNQLLIKRWNPSATMPALPYKNIEATSAGDALNKVLLERRKELVWRGLRWGDIKRLNKEGADITLTRTIMGTTYSLVPNSPRYIFPIPDDEIALSGIQQNIR